MTQFAPNTAPKTGKELVTIPEIWELTDNLEPCRELLEMLTFRRPNGTKTERKFIAKFLKRFPDMKQDAYGNCYMQVGEGTPQVLWCSHTDTVHSTAGYQKLGWASHEVGLWEKEEVQECLGADNTAGVWLMCQLIMHKKPGLYIFHRDEEVGRKGSQWIADKKPEMLKGIKVAIALDRKGTQSIITFQCSTRCCSEDFSDSLAKQLGMGYKSDPTGSFTDSASYTDIIPECTNLSVGFTKAHSEYERQDLRHIFELRDALLRLNYDKLVIKREPGENEKRYNGYSSATSYQGHQATHYYNGHARYWDTATNSWKSWDDEWDEYNAAVKASEKETKEASDKLAKYKGWRAQQADAWKGTRFEPGYSKSVDTTGAEFQEGDAATDDDDTQEDEYGFPTPAKDFDAFVKLVAAHPMVAADILESMGYSYEEFAAEVMAMYGCL